MPLHISRNGYTFRADAHMLAIEPGPKLITLTRAELEQLGLLFKDQHYFKHTAEDEDEEEEGIIGAMMNALSNAMARCQSPKDEWIRRNLRRAIFVVGGLGGKDIAGMLDPGSVLLSSNFPATGI